MTDKPGRQGADVAAPTEGNIEVLSLTTSASAQQDITGLQDRFVTFISDVAFWITFGDQSGTITDPDEAATSGGGRTWRVPADFEFHRRIKSGFSDGFKAKGSAAGKLRWYDSTGTGSE